MRLALFNRYTLGLSLLALTILNACNSSQVGDIAMTDTPAKRLVSNIANPNNLLAATWSFGNWSARVANTRSVPTSEDSDGFLDSLTASTYGWTGTQFTVGVGDVVNSSVYMAVPVGSPSITVRVAIQNTSGTEFAGAGVGGLNGQLFTITSTPQRYAPPAWTSTATGTVQLAITGVNPGKTIQLGGVRVFGSATFSQEVLFFDFNTRQYRVNAGANQNLPSDEPLVPTSVGANSGGRAWGPLYIQGTNAIESAKIITAPWNSSVKALRARVQGGSNWNGTNYPRTDVIFEGNVLTVKNASYLQRGVEYRLETTWYFQGKVNLPNEATIGWQLHQGLACGVNPIGTVFQGTTIQYRRVPSPFPTVVNNCNNVPTYTNTQWGNWGALEWRKPFINAIAANTLYTVRFEFKLGGSGTGYLKMFLNNAQLPDSYVGDVGYYLDTPAGFDDTHILKMLTNYHFGNANAGSTTLNNGEQLDLWVGPTWTLSRKP